MQQENWVLTKTIGIAPLIDRIITFLPVDQYPDLIHQLGLIKNDVEFLELPEERRTMIRRIGLLLNKWIDPLDPPDHMLEIKRIYEFVAFS